jgi:hypothetical protein
MWAKRTEYRPLVGKPEGKKLLGRSRLRLVDNIKMDLVDIEWDVAYWIGLSQDWCKWKALVNEVMNFSVS